MKAFAKHCGILLLYALLTCVFLWPLPRHLPTALVSAESGDPLMQIWAVQWNIHKLSTSLDKYFDANIFYPYENTFAYHDHMFGLGLLGWPVQAISHNPLLTYNLLLMLSFLLSAYGMYWFAKEVCHSEYAAWIAGLVFGFLPYRFAHLDHLNLLSIQWFPVCLLFLNRVLFSRTGTLGRERIFRNLLALAGFWFFFLLQVLTSFNYLFMLAFAIGLYGIIVLVIQALLYRRILVSTRMIVFFVLGACLVGLLLLPFALPYLRANRDMGFERTLAEAQSLSARPQNYLAAPDDNWLYGDITRRFQSATSPFPREQILFPGIVVMLLTIIGIVGQPRKFTRSSPNQQRAYMILGSGNTLKNFTILKIALLVLCASAVVLSFGPAATVFGRHVSLPYSWLYQYAPGFKSMRVPARFGLLAAFALTMLAVIGVAYIHNFLLCRKGKRRSWSYVVATLLLSAVIVVEYVSFPKPVTSYPGTIDGISSVYQWLAQQPEDVSIIELPVRSAKDDFEYTYYSTFHWKRLVNGRSAFIPNGITQVFGAMRNFSSHVELLESLGIDYVLLHTDKFSEPLKQEFPEGVIGSQTFDDTLVLQLPQSPQDIEGQWLHVEYQIPDQLHPAEEYRIGAFLQSMLQEPISPLPQERLQLHVQWWQGDYPIDDAVSAVHLPILFRNTDPVSQVVVMKTPELPGDYRLVMRTSSPLIDAASSRLTTTVTVTPVAVDSRHPDVLQAEFLKIESPEVWQVGQPLPVRVMVRNTGNTLWKAHIPDRQQPAGEVHLGVVAWHDAVSGVPFDDQRTLQGSRGFLPYDVGPGQEVSMKADIRTPDIPGTYTIELNLVSELIQWFPQDTFTIMVTLE